MTRFLVIGLVALALVTAAGPTLVALMHSAVPLVLVVGVVVVLLRAVWFYTNRW